MPDQVEIRSTDDGDQFADWLTEILLQESCDQAETEAEWQEARQDLADHRAMTED